MSGPAPIEPDDKDWTWVLLRVCPECGFDGNAVVADSVAPMIRENAAAWTRVLAGDDGAVRARTRPDRWSTLEYGCHVRDVYRLYRYRLGLMLDQDDPQFANWDQDATAVEERYHEADPLTVSAELVSAADTLADGFEGVSEGQWSRPGRRSDGASFTIDSFARYLIHDPVHHLWDVWSGA